MTDEVRLPNPLKAISNLPPGSAVIYRHYGVVDRAGFGLTVSKLTRDLGHLFLVAGDRQLAYELDADGTHMPEALSFRLEDGEPFRRADGTKGFNTVAAHSADALDRAANMGVDAALLSPIFATQSHPGKDTLGSARGNAMARQAALPVYALGGISEETAQSLEEGAFCGIAAIGALTKP